MAGINALSACVSCITLLLERLLTDHPSSFSLHIVLTPITYWHQYHRLLSLRSSAGISISATFLTTLVAQSQVATMYYLFHSAPDMREGVPVATPPCIRDHLNLAQIVIQWLCSLAQLALVVTLPNTATDGRSATSTAASPSSGSAVTYKTTVTWLLVLHALLFLLSIPVGGRSQDIIFNIIRNINAAIANPIFTFLAAMAFLIQANVTLYSSGGIGALSRWSLALQVVVFAVLAVSWPFRLILPSAMWRVERNKPTLLKVWYPWVGWACVNSAVVAIGQAVVLCIALNKVDDRWSGVTGERRHLLD